MDREDIFAVALIIGVPSLLIAAIVAAVLALAAADCRAYEHVTGLPTRFAVGTCYVKENDRWLSYDERRLANATVGQ